MRALQCIHVETAKKEKKKLVRGERVMSNHQVIFIFHLFFSFCLMCIVLSMKFNPLGMDKYCRNKSFILAKIDFNSFYLILMKKAFKKTDCP